VHDLAEHEEILVAVEILRSMWPQRQGGRDRIPRSQAGGFHAGRDSTPRSQTCDRAGSFSQQPSPPWPIRCFSICHACHRHSRTCVVTARRHDRRSRHRAHAPRRVALAESGLSTARTRHGLALRAGATIPSVLDVWCSNPRLDDRRQPGLPASPATGTQTVRLDASAPQARSCPDANAA
jgi:hypothetical protein